MIILAYIISLFLVMLYDHVWFQHGLAFWQITLLAVIPAICMLSIWLRFWHFLLLVATVLIQIFAWCGFLQLPYYAYLFR